MTNTKSKTAQAKGTHKMTTATILLTIITAALITAGSLACSNTTQIPETPTDLPTATEEEQTTLPTSTPETTPQTPAATQETQVNHQDDEPTSKGVATGNPANAAGSQSRGTPDIEDILENGLANESLLLRRPLRLPIRRTASGRTKSRLHTAQKVSPG